MGEFGDFERSLIDFERSWWLQADATTKAAAIRDMLGISPSSYYASIEQLLDLHAALLYDPLVITRLRRRRTARRRIRIDGVQSRHSHPH